MERTVPPSMISIWKPESAEGEAQGRPVGVAVVRARALLVADDVGNTVGCVTPASAAAATPATPTPSQ